MGCCVLDHFEFCFRCGIETSLSRTSFVGFIMSGRRSSPNFLGWNVGNKVKVTKVKINHVQASCRVTSVLVKGSADGYSFGAGAVVRITF